MKLKIICFFSIILLQGVYAKSEVLENKKMTSNDIYPLTLPENIYSIPFPQPHLTPFDPSQCYMLAPDFLASPTTYDEIKREFFDNNDFKSAWIAQNEYLNIMPFVSRKDIKTNRKDLDEKLIKELEQNDGLYFKQTWLMNFPKFDTTTNFFFKYGDFYIGQMCRPHNCYDYHAQYAWNPKTKELVRQLSNYRYSFEFLSDEKISQEGLEALACFKSLLNTRRKGIYMIKLKTSSLN